MILPWDISSNNVECVGPIGKQGFVFRKEGFNLLKPGDTYMRHQTGPSLVQVMACRLFGAKPCLNLLSNGPLGTYFSKFFIEIQIFPLKKMYLEMSSAKWWPSCLGLKCVLSFLSRNYQNAYFMFHQKLFSTLSGMITYVESTLMRNNFAVSGC